MVYKTSNINKMESQRDTAEFYLHVWSLTYSLFADERIQQNTARLPEVDFNIRVLFHPRFL